MESKNGDKNEERRQEEGRPDQGALPLESYFGGKSRIATLAWDHLGSVANYIEPFCGSAAILLARPDRSRIETINDPSLMVSNFNRAVGGIGSDPGLVADAFDEAINDSNPYLANVWRSLQNSPLEVAHAADFPVDENYVHAVHRWLMLGDEAAAFRDRMSHDPDYFDPIRAGRWLHGSCSWIGSGWCDDVESNKVPDLSGKDNGSGRGIHQSSGPHQKRPRLGGGSTGNSDYGVGIHAKGPGDGLSQQIPMISAAGQGVHSSLSDNHRIQLADAYARGRGVHANDSADTRALRRKWLEGWFLRIADRLRTVRVCCGDWKRVCTSYSVTTRLGITGIFFDAPYRKTTIQGANNRSKTIYSNDSTQDVDKLVELVIAYCVERGNDPMMRILACCYEGEGYEVLADHGWREISWKTSGGYANQGKDKGVNTIRERIWASPYCIDPDTLGTPLFGPPMLVVDRPINPKGKPISNQLEMF